MFIVADPALVVPEFVLMVPAPVMEAVKVSWTGYLTPATTTAVSPEELAGTAYKTPASAGDAVVPAEVTIEESVDAPGFPAPFEYLAYTAWASVGAKYDRETDRPAVSAFVTVTTQVFVVPVNAAELAPAVK